MVEAKKNIVILGAGESGTGAAILARKLGYGVLVSDSGAIQDNFKKELLDSDIEFEENGHTAARILKADEIIKSPGIPDKAEIIQQLKKQGTPVISEIEFGYRHSSGTMIGITGTNGKSTTTALTHYILQQEGLDVALGGNIGKSLARLVAERDREFYVLELSSFQLDGLVSYRNHIAVLLNITPDHLERYDNMFQKYVESKFRIGLNQSKDDYFICNYDDEAIRKQVEKHKSSAALLPFSHKETLQKGAFIKNEHIHFNINKRENFMTSFEEVLLQGMHNRYNTMAAGIAAKLAGVRSETIRESLKSFCGLEHRLEQVAKVRGIDFINDSKGTNVNSVWYALESMKQPVVWIVGGIDKGNDYGQLATLVREKVKAIVCLGIDNSRIREAFGEDIPLMVETRDMTTAVHQAFELAKSGDAVLLSPACASFDLFRNYEDRGTQFKEAVRHL